MSPDELKSARQRLGLTPNDWARDVLGMSGERRPLRRIINQIETGERQLTEEQAQRVQAYLERTTKCT